MDVLNTGIDVNFLNNDGIAPIHAIVRRKRRDRLDLLMALMTYTEVDVNFETTRGMTPLHIAVEVGGLIYGAL